MPAAATGHAATARGGTSSLPTVPPGHKWCRRCEEIKPWSAFARNASAKDGLQGHCRDCQASAYRVHRERLGRIVRPRDVPEGHKFCRGCGEIKPLGEWSPSRQKTDGLKSRCKECIREAARREHLHKSYGISEEEVAALLEGQGGLCAICRVAPAIHIDHDHATGTIRGMLCFRCNVAIGHFRDDPETLLRAARYLLSAAQERRPIELYLLTGLTRFDYGPAS